jgi:transposase InsO family protein
MSKIRAAKPKKNTTSRKNMMPFQRGYVDAVGPFPLGVGDNEFFYIYVCDDTYFGLVEAGKGRDFEKDIKPVVTAWRLEARDNGWNMEQLHFDSDPIFLSAEFQEWLGTLDINAYYAPPGQHWANGLVERFIQTIKNNAKAMLRASGLPAKYWFYAIKHAVFMHNQTWVKKLKPHHPLA